MSKKVAIIGTVDASRRHAPYADNEWEIWACSPGNRGACPRVTRWFELHAINDLEGHENNAWRDDYFAWLRAQQFPVYMQERNRHVPQATVFPRDVLVKRFGRNWFSSSIAFMMALAIHEMRPDGKPVWDDDAEIGIFGVDMAATEEHYGAQKAGCIRFTEFANELGIKVSIPNESCLGMAPQLYGYAEASRFGRRMVVRELEIKSMVAQLEGQIKKLTEELCFFKGALEDVAYIRRTFVDGLDDADLGDPVAPTPKIAGLPQMSDFERSPSQALLVPKSDTTAAPAPAPKHPVPAAKPAANGAKELR